MTAMTPATLPEPSHGFSQPDIHQPLGGNELKRKAFPPEAGQSEAKRSRTRAVSGKAWRGPTSREQPEKGSLNDILHARPGERLFVHPFAWRPTRQLELLQLTFTRAELPSGGRGHARDKCCTAAEPGDKVEDYVKDLGSVTLKGQELGVEGLVKLFGMRRLRRKLLLRYVLCRGIAGNNSWARRY